MLVGEDDTLLRGMPGVGLLGSKKTAPLAFQNLLAIRKAVVVSVS